MPQRTIEYGVVLGARRTGTRAYRATQQDLAKIERYASTAQTGFSRLGSIGVRALQGIGRVVTRVVRHLYRMARMVVLVGTAMAVEFGRRSVNAFADFEQAVTNALTVTGLAGVEFDNARKALSAFGLELAKQSNKMATEIADAFYSLASAGLNVAQVMEASRGVLALAEGTLAPMQVTTELVTSTMKAFGLQATDVTRIVNAMAASIGGSRLNMQRLSFALPYASAAAKQTGVSLEEVLSALAMLSDRGLRAEQAGTGLRQLLLRTGDVAGKGARALKEYGLSIEDINVRTQGLYTVLSRLQRLSPEAITQIFGLEGANAVNILRMNVREMEKFEQSITGTSRAFDMQRQQLDTLQGQWRAFVGDVQKLQIEFARGLNPALRDGLQYLREYVQGLSDGGGVEAFGAQVGAFGADLAKRIQQFGPEAQNAMVDFWQSVTSGEARKNAFAEMGAAMKTAFVDAFGEIIDTVKAGFHELGRALMGEDWGTFLSNMKTAFREWADVAKDVSEAVAAIAPHMAALTKRIAKFTAEHPKMALAFGAILYFAKELIPLLGILLARGGGAAGGARGIGGVAQRLRGFFGKGGGRALPSVTQAPKPGPLGIPGDFWKPGGGPVPWFGAMMPGLEGLRKYETTGTQAAIRAWQVKTPIISTSLREQIAAAQGPMSDAARRYQQMTQWTPEQWTREAQRVQGLTPPRPRATFMPEESWRAGPGGRSVTINISASDENRIGEIAQQEYDRATGRERRQLVR